jgi:23S rRNA pseudouridine1911/1915/1917 synthase
MSNLATVQRKLTITEDHAGLRLDQAAAKLWPEFSRSRLSAWIKTGELTVNGLTASPKQALQGDEELHLSAVIHDVVADAPQDIALNVLYADDTVIVINKPAGLVVHPGAGNPDGTLVNALLHYDEALAQLPRAGIVHRLDKDTSGCLVIARTLAAHTHLVASLAEREVGREYQALVCNIPVAGGLIDVPIARHPSDRLRQAASENGREAITHFRVEERFRAHAHLRLKLETGRTHQIRVHLQYAGFPIVGDPLYAGRFRKPKHISLDLLELLRATKRQMLHAYRLTLTHPLSGKTLKVEAPPPADYVMLRDLLEKDADAAEMQS